MAEADLVPIEPAQDNDGRLIRLIDLLGKDDAFPYPPRLEERDRRAPYGSIAFKRISTRFAAKLGVTGAFDFNGEWFADSAVWEIRYGTTKHNSDGDAKVLATFWGSALRLLLRVRALDAKATGSFANLAAAVETKAAQVEYEATLVGSATPRLFAAALRGLPLFGSLDMAAYESLMGGVSRISGMLADRLTESKDFRPIAVELNYKAPDSAQDEALATRFSMLRIARGLSQQQAQQINRGRFDVDIIRETYRRVLGTAEVISDEHKALARDWLDG
jgi:hypothetical protein